MGGNFVQTYDSRPFFIRAVRLLKEEGLPASEYEVFKQELVDVTMEVAKKYYSTVKKSYLELSVDNVCGIISLALAEKSQGDITKAAELLRREGSLWAFRVGWGLVMTLVKMEKEAKLKENDLETLSVTQQELVVIKLISAPADKPWRGWLAYQDRTRFNQLKLDKYAVIELLVRKVFKSDQHLKKSRHSKDQVTTGFVCLAAGKKFNRALTLVEVRELVDFFWNNPEGSIVAAKQTVEDLKMKFSPRLRPAFEAVGKEYVHDILEPLQSALAENRKEVFKLFSKALVVSSSADVGIRSIFQEEQKNTHAQSTRSLLDDLANDPATIDTSDAYHSVRREAFIGAIVERLKKGGWKKGDLIPAHLADLITYTTPEELTGKIVWHRLEWVFLEEAYLALGDKKKERFMLSEILSVRHSASGKLWWTKRTPSMEFYFRQHGFEIRTMKKRHRIKIPKLEKFE